MGLSFSDWMEFEASIPMQDKDGEWFDLDTGIYFHEYNPPKKDQPPRYSPSAKTAEARAKARKNGGRALRGSSKQKEWAEKIRMQKLSALNDEQKQMVLRLDVLHAAKFWIEQVGLLGPLPLGDLAAEHQCIWEGPGQNTHGRWQADLQPHQVRP